MPSAVAPLYAVYPPWGVESTKARLAGLGKRDFGAVRGKEGVVKATSVGPGGVQRLREPSGG